MPSLEPMGICARGLTPVALPMRGPATIYDAFKDVFRITKPECLTEIFHPLLLH